MDIKIRRAKESDINDLFKLVEKFATSFIPKKELFVENINYLLLDKSVFLRVAEYEDKLIGYCLGFDHFTFYANGRVSWVEEIIVEEAYRNEGVGTNLMSCFEEWSKSRKSQLVALATRRAANFYKTLGYNESATYFRKLL
ncbi:GNAT family N-acetyltransferase [Cytobacillus sp. Hm23]